jgi:uncharacterized membrane protein YkoI
MRIRSLILLGLTACGAPDLAATQQPTTPTAPCAGAIDPATASAIAEQRVGGTAIANIADDDDPCDREVQVQAKDTVWEVKVAPDGRVLEVERSDEDREGDETDDDDDD